MLWENGRPTGAYELIDALNRRDLRPIAPPTVYRALEFLIAQRLVTKVESRNAYVPCAHPERRHNCLFFVCHQCGASAELEDPRIEGLLAENAVSVGYRAIRRVIEVEGICPDCSATGSLEDSEHGGAMMSV
jgi:Fur family zinc uptake transcriptional regulator